MAARVRRRESELTFETLSIEGGLLAPEWLARVAQLQAGQQTEVDYRIPKGLSLRDEIGRHWRIAQAHWQEFAAGRQRSAEPLALSERFIQGLLADAFGFASLRGTPPVRIDERVYPIGMAALGGRVPVVVGSAGVGVDVASAIYGDGGRRRSAFGLVQEFLNASTSATWGVVSDGCVLRLVRDNASLTRPAWIEADLVRIFQEERYADFAALWLLSHESRFGTTKTESVDGREEGCPLETWRLVGRDEGIRARDALRDGFEDALRALGQGFLSHPDNAQIRTELRDGTLSKDAFFLQLLRLVYRFIFLLTVEERGLLHPPATPQDAQDLYRAGYSLHRLRDRAVRRSAHDRFSDLWESLKVSIGGLAGGQAALGLPALAGLFAVSRCNALDRSAVQNRFLLQAIFRLCWLKEDSGLVRVNWRDMGPEELGGVYEGLLELVPQITTDCRGFSFAHGNEVGGNSRKATSSYYTPDSLVQMLLDSALEPVIADTIAKNPGKAAEALLGLAIVDPACGSGHFLLAASRRLAAHLARLRANSTPSAADYRHAIREVISRSIYGVDQNAMAVELCHVSLWMEAVEPGLPLTFLESHIQCGNSLIGITHARMPERVPDEAWTPIDGDDDGIAKALRKRNRQETAGHVALPFTGLDLSQKGAIEVASAVKILDAASDADVVALESKASAWRSILNSIEFQRQRFVCDAWCAAFFWPKQLGAVADAAPTHGRWEAIRDGRESPSSVLKASVSQIATQFGFFHWHLQFPQVFAKGGFDVVLGNPPWDEIQFEETAWFAARAPEVAGATSAAERSTSIASLETSQPVLYAEYRAALRRVAGIKHFISSSGVYPIGVTGKLNTSTLFTARSLELWKADSGAMGLVVLSGIATDKGASDVFAELMSSGRLRSLFDFVNRKLLFPAVRPHQHFCLLTAASGKGASCEFAAFLEAPSELGEPERRYCFSWDEIVRINPEGRSLLLFRSSAQATVTRNVCARFQPLGAQVADEGWQPQFQQGTFNVASASGIFRSSASLASDGYKFEPLAATNDPMTSYVPLFDAKMARQFEWRAASLVASGNQFRKIGSITSTLDQLDDPAFVPEFANWVPTDEADARLRTWSASWLLGFKDVTGVTSTRMAAFAFVPRMGFGHGFPLLKLSADAVGHAFAAGWLNSLLVEWLLRQRMQGLHLTWHILSQIPVPSREQAATQAPWDNRVSLAEWLARRVAELSCTSWELAGLANELIGQYCAFRYTPERRFWLRLEIEAAVFVYAGLGVDEALSIMDQLEKVAAREQSDYGEYRSRRELPALIRQLTDSQRTGVPYQTNLDPPPADQRVSHRDTRVSSSGSVGQSAN